jgi:hypothetical protein
MANVPSGAQSISLGDLVASTSTSVLRALQEQEKPGKLINPKIWVGIWIDLDRFGPQGPLAGPGAGPG